MGCSVMAVAYAQRHRQTKIAVRERGQRMAILVWLPLYEAQKIQAQKNSKKHSTPNARPLYPQPLRPHLQIEL